MSVPRCGLSFGPTDNQHHCIKEFGHHPDTEHVCGCGWTTIERLIKCRCGCPLYDHENDNGPCLICGCPEFREEQ